MKKQLTMSLPNIGYRIRLARHRAHISREELADQCRVDAPTIAQWENDLARPSRHHMEMAGAALRTNVNWLLNDQAGRGPYSAWMNLPVPVYSHDYARPDIENAIRKRKGLIGYLRTNAFIGERGFGLRIDDASMVPELRQGDYVLIDPDVTPQPGDYVAAHNSGNHPVVIRKYRPGTPIRGRCADVQLKPLNEDWPVIVLNARSPESSLAP